MSPDAVLMIFKNKIVVDGLATDEVMFIPPRIKEREIWTGRIASLQEASDISGIDNCFLSMDLYSFPVSDTMFKTVLYGSLPAGMIDERDDTLDLFNLVDVFKRKFSFPPANGDSFLLPRIIAALREVKQKEEMTLMRKAISVTCEAQNQMMRATKPGMTEYQVQAVGEYFFRKNGCESIGYPSICGGGQNSCILHYQTNRKTLHEGDLILLDMGAEYHGYTADVTRTLPVGGKFSAEQRIIYDLVKEARDSAFLECKMGKSFQAPHKAAVRVIKNGLLKLGIIEKEAEFTTYFMHGTSHYLGLDVHDAGTRTALKEGNVITVEPGIYIAPNSPCDPKWWNIGIRIEDDILITSKGFENLSESSPVDASEIEKMMAEPFIQEVKK